MSGEKSLAEELANKYMDRMDVTFKCRESVHEADQAFDQVVAAINEAIERCAQEADNEKEYRFVHNQQFGPNGNPHDIGAHIAAQAIGCRIRALKGGQ